MIKDISFDCYNAHSVLSVNIRISCKWREDVATYAEVSAALKDEGACTMNDRKDIVSNSENVMVPTWREAVVKMLLKIIQCCVTSGMIAGIGYYLVQRAFFLQHSDDYVWRNYRESS